MSVITYIRPIIAVFVTIECSNSWPCPPHHIQPFAYANEFLLYGVQNQYTRVLRVYTGTSAKAFQTTVDHNTKLQAYKQRYLEPTRTEEIYGFCTFPGGKPAAITQNADAFILHNENRDGIPHENAIDVLRDILTGVNALRAAGINDLNLNFRNLIELAGQINLLTGPASIGCYRDRLVFTAPEVLLSPLKKYPSSESWFVGVVYFTLLTGRKVFPLNRRLYGRLEMHSRCRNEEQDIDDKTKRELQLMTVYIWRKIWFEDPDEELTDDDRAILDQLAMDQEVNNDEILILRNEIHSNLQQAHITTKSIQLLRGLLRISTVERLQPEQALDFIPLLVPAPNV